MRRYSARLRNGYLLALNPLTGAEEWQLDLDGRSPLGWTATETGDVIVTSDVLSEGDQSAPVVQRVDGETGEVRWASSGRELTDIQWTDPVILGDLVLVMDVSSFAGNPSEKVPSAISAYDLSSGDLRWVTTLDDTTEASAFTQDTIVTDSTRNPPLLLAQTVGGIIFRLDPISGAELWRTSVPASGIVGLSANVVTVENIAGTQFHYSLEDGTLVD